MGQHASEPQALTPLDSLCDSSVQHAVQVNFEKQATPAHRHPVPHEPAATFIRRLQPILQDPVTEDPRPAVRDLITRVLYSPFPQDHLILILFTGISTETDP